MGVSYSVSFESQTGCNNRREVSVGLEAESTCCGNSGRASVLSDEPTHAGSFSQKEREDV